jgi:hypothetical protein
MVPFNGDPAAMKIPSNTYPKASAGGSYRYRKTVSLKALKAAFAKSFGDPDLDLDRRVVIIHGLPMTTKPPFRRLAWDTYSVHDLRPGGAEI